MLEFLHVWVTNIAIIVVFTALLEILLPNSDMKRYIKVIIGLLVLLVIVKPFVMLNEIDISFKKDLIETGNFINTGPIKEDSESISKYQSEKALEIYKSNIAGKIKEIISTNKNIDQNVSNVDIDIENNISSQAFGKIKALKIEMRSGKGLTVEVNKINSININKNKKVINEENLEYNLNDKVEDEIKTNLSNFFGLDKSAIQVILKN